MIQPHVIFFLAGIGFIVTELFLGVSAGFDLVVIGGSLLIGGLFAWLTGNMYVGIGATAIAALVYFAFLRVKIQRSLASSTHKLNVDQLIGKKGVVTSAIGSHTAGQVTVDGEVWRAMADGAIAQGTTVVVKKAEGVTLLVHIH